jgi:hypothetical protein
MGSIYAAAQTTQTYYRQVVESTAQGALESCLELYEQDPEHNLDQAIAITDENYYEATVGFGSPLDAIDNNDGDEDRVALAFLSFSPNRHAVMTEERYARWSQNDPRKQAMFFMGEGCIDYRFLAVCALHADIMALFRQKLTEAVPSQGQSSLD